MNSTEGAEGHLGSFEGAVTPRGRGAFPFIGNAPYADPATPAEGHEGFVKILLSEAASKHLEATGETCFRIIAQDMSNDHTRRYVIHLAPCPLATARQAEGILLGTHRAVKLRTTSKP